METDWSTIADVDGTRSAYRQFTPHVCKCSFCRNLRSQWAQWMTGENERLLSSLGIDPAKPTEIIDFGKAENGRLYQVEWAFLIASKDAPPARDKQMEYDNATIYIWPGGIPEPCFDNTGRKWSVRIRRNNVPWLLSEPEPD